MEEKVWKIAMEEEGQEASYGGRRSGSELWRKKVRKRAMEEEGQEASYGGRRSGSELWRKKVRKRAMEEEVEGLRGRCAVCLFFSRKYILVRK